MADSWYYIYDNENEEWINVGFASFEAAEDFVIKNLEKDFITFSIFEKIV